jgi:L-asparagine oxygenase
VQEASSADTNEAPDLMGAMAPGTDSPDALRPAAQVREPLRGGGPLTVVELSDEDRAQAGAGVDGEFLDALEESGVQPATTDFFDAAEIAEGAMPEAARAAFASLRRGSVDALVIRGLPHDAEPGPTPRKLGETSSGPRRGHAWLAMAVRRLGYEFSYAMEKKGALVHHIHPTKEMAMSQSNASWQVDLSMHTENAFHPLRPDFVLLYCVRAPENAPSTRLAPIDDVVAHLTDQEVGMLSEERFGVHVVDSFKIEGEEDLELPVRVLNGSVRHPIVRWHETLHGKDEAAERVCRAFEEASQRATLEVALQPGDLLAFNNQRCLHGRGRFDARLGGHDRWLLRSYVVRDPTPLRACTAPARPRVMRMDLHEHAGI